MLNTNPTRSLREMYDRAPDYLEGEEDIERADREGRERMDDDHADEVLTERRDRGCTVPS
jgi:hypothetical protein